MIGVTRIIISLKRKEWIYSNPLSMGLIHSSQRPEGPDVRKWDLDHQFVMDMSSLYSGRMAIYDSISRDLGHSPQKPEDPDTVGMTWHQPTSNSLKRGIINFTIVNFQILKAVFRFKLVTKFPHRILSILA